jgi:uncharacterized protein YcbK (DUF882 family)
VEKKRAVIIILQQILWFTDGRNFAINRLSIFAVNKEMNNIKIHRRDFIKIGGMTAISAAAASLSGASLPALGPQDRTLSFYNTHTRERLQACYFKNRALCADSLSQIDHILRDHRTGDIKEIDRKLLDLLFVLRKKLKTNKPFHIISGYRSPKTNGMLRKNSQGIAKNSLHMEGQAIDIRIPQLPLTHLRKTAMSLMAGGVGYYPDSDFIHVDVGWVRYW